MHRGFRGAPPRASLREPCIVREVYRRLSFPEESTQRHDVCAVIDTCGGHVNVNRIHHQPDMTSGERNIGGSKLEEEEEDNPMHEV
jgi:hypothetical protein